MKAVENCPMWSLRSHSIAARFARSVGAVFFQMRSMKHVQQKQLWLRFAQELYARYARLDAKASDQSKGNQKSKILKAVFQSV